METGLTKGANDGKKSATAADGVVRVEDGAIDAHRLLVIWLFFSTFIIALVVGTTLVIFFRNNGSSETGGFPILIATVATLALVAAFDPGRAGVALITESPQLLGLLLATAVISVLDATEASDGPSTRLTGAPASRQNVAPPCTSPHEHWRTSPC